MKKPLEQERKGTPERESTEKGSTEKGKFDPKQHERDEQFRKDRDKERF